MRVIPCVQHVPSVHMHVVSHSPLVSIVASGGRGLRYSD
jgi:hypothetical protein